MLKVLYPSSPHLKFSIEVLSNLLSASIVVSNDLDASDDYRYLSLWAIWCHYYCSATNARRVVSYRTKSKGPTRWWWWWWSSNRSSRSSNSNNNYSSSRRRKRLYRDIFVLFLFLSKKKKSTIDTVCSIYYIVNQINDMELMWEERKEDGVRPAAREVHVYSFCTIDVTPTPTPQLMLLLLLLLLRTKKHSTDREKMISMYPFWRVCCHIQYTYKSSPKINLFSLQLKIK